jgi:hypothetical protein
MTTDSKASELERSIASIDAHLQYIEESKLRCEAIANDQLRLERDELRQDERDKERRDAQANHDAWIEWCKKEQTKQTEALVAIARAVSNLR